MKLNLKRSTVQRGWAPICHVLNVNVVVTRQLEPLKTLSGNLRTHRIQSIETNLSELETDVSDPWQRVDGH